MRSTNGPGSPPGRPALPLLIDMWDALLAQDWPSLGVVPADHRVSLDVVVAALEASARTAARPVHIVDARGLDVAQGRRLAGETSADAASGRRPVFVVDSLMRSLSGVHLIQSASLVLVVVHAEGMEAGSTSSTVDLVGADRVLGMIVAAPAT
jgi:hypothetical protein